MMTHAKKTHIGLKGFPLTKHGIILMDLNLLKNRDP